MTNTDRSMDNPLPAHLATVAAFIDGEPVDGAALEQALATEDGREYLVDLLALRRCVATMEPASLLATAERPRLSSPGRRVAGWWAAAAAVALLGSMGGYFAGERAGLVAEVQGAHAAVEAVAAFEPAPRAPQPTHVIQLRTGVDADASEGN